MAPSPTKLPEFEHPPVVEVVIGGQCGRGSKLNVAHLGAFWNFLGLEEWPLAKPMMAIPVVSERFDGEFTQPQLAFVIPQKPTCRIRYDHKDGKRLIQIQEDRFHVNFLRNDGPYMGFSSAYDEFDIYYEKWIEFHKLFNLEPARFEFSEITYVDRIPNNDLWKDPSGWVSVLPKVAATQTIDTGSGVLSSDPGGTWRFSNPDLKCRLYVELTHQKASKDQPEYLDLKMTARGVVPPAETLRESFVAFKAGIRLGHDAIIRSFFELTSEKMHKIWGLK